MEKKKYYEITPSPNTSYDSLIIKAGKTWEACLNSAESSLDDQFNEKPWTEIKVTIKCIELTDEEFADQVETED